LANQAVAPVAVVLPQAMDDHSVEAREILPKPFREARRVAIVVPHRAQRVHRKALPLDIGLRWVIQADQLHG
jgi:hypothetical protein